MKIKQEQVPDPNQDGVLGANRKLITRHMEKKRLIIFWNQIHHSPLPKLFKEEFETSGRGGLPSLKQIIGNMLVES